MSSAVGKKKGKIDKIILFEKKYSSFSCNFPVSPYLCIVFFIVLDLRLTRLGYSGIPFFFAYRSKWVLIIHIGFGTYFTTCYIFALRFEA